MKHIVFFLLLAPMILSGTALSWYGAKELGIVGQTCWILDTTGVDRALIAAGGGSTCGTSNFVSFAVFTNASNLEIPPGVYKTWFKCETLPDSYDQSFITLDSSTPPITIGLGHSNAEDTGEGNQWKYLGLLNIVNPGTNITNVKFTLSRTNNHSAYYVAAYALYMNTDTNVTLVNASEAIQTWIPPTTTNTSASIPGNLLVNSSFEMQPPSGVWSIGIGGTRFWTLYESFSPISPYDGNTCLRMDFSRCTTNYITPMVAQSKPVRLRENRAHTLSVWARATTTGATLQLALRNPVGYPANETFPPQPFYQNASQSIPTNWTRFFLRNQILWEYPYCEYSPYFSVTASNGGQVFLDAAQLEEGATETTYTNSPFTIGFSIPDYASLLYPEDVGQIKTVIHNNSGTNKTATIDWDMYYRGYIPYTNGSYTVSTTSGTLTTNDFPLPEIVPGFYRITSHLRGNDEVQAEYDFTLCNTPTSVDQDPTQSVIGFHSFHYHYQMQQFNRAGLRNYRSLSPGGFFRYSSAHPSTNTYVWFDNEIANIQQYGHEVLGELQYDFSAPGTVKAFITMNLATTTGTFQVGETYTTTTGASGRITWVSQPEDPFTHKCIQATNAIGSYTIGSTLTGTTSGATGQLTPGIDGQTPNQLAIMSPSFPLGEWYKFVTNVVAHYTNIHTWEMLNEPGGGLPQMNSDGGQTASAVLTRDGVRGIRAIRPTDTICILGGAQDPDNYATRHWNALPADVKTNVQAASYHLYCTTVDGRGTLAKKWCSDRNLEFWNTETGYEDGISMLTVSDSRHYNGFAIQPFMDTERDILKFARTPRIVATNVIETVWPGANRYYYYDMRHSADAVADIYSKPGSHYSTIQMHDSFKAKMSTLIFQNGILQRYSPIRGLVVSNSVGRVHCMTGKTNGQWLAMYSPRVTNAVMGWTLTTNQFELYNLEGAPVRTTGTNVYFGSNPTFVRGINGTTLNTLTNAAIAAQYNFVADTTAPIVLFKTAPIGNVTPRENEAGLIISWVGYDDVSAPTASNMHCMKYRFKIDSLPFTDWEDDSLLPPQSFPTIFRRRSQRDSSVVFTAPGEHTFYVEARDEAGNTNSTQRTFFIQL